MLQIQLPCFSWDFGIDFTPAQNIFHKNAFPAPRSELLFLIFCKDKFKQLNLFNEAIISWGNQEETLCSKKILFNYWSYTKWKRKRINRRQTIIAILDITMCWYTLIMVAITYRENNIAMTTRNKSFFFFLQRKMAEWWKGEQGSEINVSLILTKDKKLLIWIYKSFVSL